MDIQLGEQALFPLHPLFESNGDAGKDRDRRWAKDLTGHHAGQLEQRFVENVPPIIKRLDQPLAGGPDDDDKAAGIMDQMMGKLPAKAWFGLFAEHGVDSTQLVWAKKDAMTVAVHQEIRFLAVGAPLNLHPPLLRRRPEFLDFHFFERVDGFFFDRSVLIAMTACCAGSACPLACAGYSNLVGIGHWATITHCKSGGFEKRPPKEAIMQPEPAMERDETLDLLRSQHEFPGLFTFRVILQPDQSSTVVSAMVAAAGTTARIDNIAERPSRNNKYLALGVTMELEDAERVLDVYQVLQTLDGILAVM